MTSSVQTICLAKTVYHPAHAKITPRAIRSQATASVQLASEVTIVSWDARRERMVLTVRQSARVIEMQLVLLLTGPVIVLLGIWAIAIRRVRQTFMDTSVPSHVSAVMEASVIPSMEPVRASDSGWESIARNVRRVSAVS